MSRLSFTEALDQALELLEQGHPLEYCVRQFPDYTDELRPLLQVSDDLHRLAGAPLPLFDKSTIEPDWDSLLADVPQKQPGPFERYSLAIVELFRSLQYHPVQRYAALTAAVVILAVIGWRGSAESHPRSALYQIKQFTEKVELGVALSPESEVERRIEFTRRRLEELQTLTYQTHEIDPELLRTALSQAQGAVKAAQQGGVGQEYYDQLASLLADTQASISQLKVDVPAPQVAVLNNADLEVAELREDLNQILIAEIGVTPTPQPDVPTPTVPSPTRPITTPAPTSEAGVDPGQDDLSVIPSVTTTTTTPNVPTRSTPTLAPTAPIASATPRPTTTPIPVPTDLPTPVPTSVPIVVPTAVPTVVIPTEEPTLVPTQVPTAVPTTVPTTVPTQLPTPVPTTVPTQLPTMTPTSAPIIVPTEEPTEEPTLVPTELPTEEPTLVPTAEPTPVPTAEPTEEPTPVPTELPTAEPTPVPTELPTATSTILPLPSETVAPTDIVPSPTPTEQTPIPTVEITITIVPPTQQPTELPTSEPTETATIGPTDTTGPLPPTETPTAEPPSSGMRALSSSVSIKGVAPVQPDSNQPAVDYRRSAERIGFGTTPPLSKPGIAVLDIVEQSVQQVDIGAADSLATQQAAIRQSVSLPTPEQMQVASVAWVHSLRVGPVGQPIILWKGLFSP